MLQDQIRLLDIGISGTKQISNHSLVLALVTAALLHRGHSRGVWSPSGLMVVLQPNRTGKQKKKSMIG